MDGMLTDINQKFSVQNTRLCFSGKEKVENLAAK
jgi:hypothetical protein